jgi:hypothetical protein
LQQVTVLSYLVDSVQITVSIPLEKISTMATLCDDFVTHKSASLHQLQVLIGNLRFCGSRGLWWLDFYVLNAFPLLKAKSSSANLFILLIKAF